MTMRLPPLLRSFSLAAIDDVLADIHGTSRLDFTPSHALTRIVDGTVLDVNRSDPWDLVSEGATATDARMDYGKPDHHSRSLELLYGGTRWIAKSTTAFNFDSLTSWSVMIPWRYDSIGLGGAGGGGWMLSTLKGPNPDDVWYPWPVYLGANRGWGVSSNGNGGGCGIAVYGATAQHNVDITSFTYSADDGRWRMLEFGYHVGNHETWLTLAHRGDEGAGVSNILYNTGSVGDTTSPDGRFATGQDYYAVVQSSFNGGLGLPLIAFEGQAAENRYAVRIAELPVLQAQLEAYE